MQTLSPEPTRCCIQVLNAVVKPQLLKLVDQLLNRVAVNSSSFSETAMLSQNGKNGKDRDGNGRHRSGRSGRSSRSASKVDEDRAREEKERKMLQKVEQDRERLQKQSDADGKAARLAKQKAAGEAEKLRVQKELQKQGIPQAPRAKKKAAESLVTESTSPDPTTRKPTQPRLLASGSSTGSAGKGKGGAQAAPVSWKQGRETLNYLTELHNTLYPSPKAREQSERIQAMHKGFLARERIRKNSYMGGSELTNKQFSYSHKKRKLRQQRIAEDQSGLTDLEQLQTAAADEDKYDSDAEQEADRLEKSLVKEKKSQEEWKKKHRLATEKRENRIVVSQKE